MTKEADLTAAKTSITRRFIACTQSTGRIGKSTVAEGLISWLRYAGVAFVAVDADSQHQTLSHRYPSDVESFDATKTLDDFARMIQALPDFPVILVDFPAQATNFLLSAAEHFRLLEFFERSGIRPTLLIFAADDPTAKESASKTVRFFGDAADYLLVENPAKYKSEEFMRTPLISWLAERETAKLRVPAVTAITINAWEALERKLNRYLPLDEACHQTGLHELCRHELGFLRDRFLVQFEDLADRVLPNPALIKNKVARITERKADVQDALNDPFLVA
jgi:hypothetical protein